MHRDRLYSPRRGQMTALQALAAAPLCIASVMFCLAAFTGLWPWSPDVYPSYALQAEAWLQGRLDLGQDYGWLELAIYQGKYYVSFPPFPSYVLLPFAVFMGHETPDALISLLFTLLGSAACVRLCLHLGQKPREALFWTLYAYLGSGYLFIGQTGYVWFMAQTMAFTLMLLALDAALENRGGWSLGFWACAVGCRPLDVLYLPLLFWLLRQKEKELPVPRWVAGHLAWAVAPTLIAASYMTLNALRFGNPIEFGHNYLPEFVRAPQGQFSFSYVPEHLLQLLRFPSVDPSTHRLVFPSIDACAFYLICPLSLTFLLALGSALRHVSRVPSAFLILLPLLLALHVLTTCMHRTLGGYQFGNRYFVDLVPCMLLGILFMKPPEERFGLLQSPFFLLGFSLNLVGAVSAYNAW